MDKLWNKIDNYIEDSLVKPDDIFRTVLRNSHNAGLPEINISPAQGKMLHIILRAISAKSVLEIGTLGGYSSIWMAKALPGNGELISLEIDPYHAEVASKNIELANLSGVIKIRTGDAISGLKKLNEEKHKPFDLIFIDADKQNNYIYFNMVMELSHVGTLIVIDNVVMENSILDSSDSLGIRKLFDTIANTDMVDATAIQTVGIKGHDGFAIIIVK